MNPNNPYQAPSANIAEPVSGTYQPRIFTSKGRIGRLRYLAYTMACYLLYLPGFMVVSAILAIAAGSSEPGGTEVAGIISGIVIFLSLAAMIIFMFIVAGRRFNDMGYSSWMSLLVIIPFFALWLTFGPGNTESNQYGPPPPANSLGVKIAALIMAVIMVAGILGAIALPVYQEYLQGAQTSQ